LALCFLVTSGCRSTGKQQLPATSKEQSTTASIQGTTITTDEQATANVSSWIASTYPSIGEPDVPTNTDIVITFAQDMDANTLNWRNITIYEQKHDHLLNDGFNYHYDPHTRKLQFKQKESYYDLGPGNGILVTLSGNIANNKGQTMNKDYTLYFGTRLQ
jgi:hypothetical protein